MVSSIPQSAENQLTYSGLVNNNNLKENLLVFKQNDTDSKMLRFGGINLL